MKKFIVFVISCALIFLGAYFPVEKQAIADSSESEVDYRYITIDGYADGFYDDTIARGETYIIRNAYIGGNSAWQIGNVSSSTDIICELSDNVVKYVSSSVVVKFNFAIITSQTHEFGSSASNDYDGIFVASNVGCYTVTYSYTYDIIDQDGNSQEFTNSHSIYVTSIGGRFRR